MSKCKNCKKEVSEPNSHYYDGKEFTPGWNCVAAKAVTQPNTPQRIVNRPEWMPPIAEVDALAADMAVCRADNGDLAVMLYETGMRAFRSGELASAEHSIASAKRINSLEQLIAEYLPVCADDCGCEGANLGCEVLSEEDIEVVRDIFSRQRWPEVSEAQELK